jgi:glycosyltransferase involved in cell wall biosynthesis
MHPSVKYLKISVITISYNQGCYLESAIKSVLTQNYPEVEYIIIDGGSRDNSIEIINKYKKQLKYWISEKDEGPASGLNKGLKLCTGDIFCYLNADDLFIPHSFFFINQYFQQNSKIDGVIGSVFIIDEHGRRSLRRRLSSHFSIKTFLNGTAMAMQQATFLRKECLKGIVFNVNNSTCWDTELLVDCCINGAKYRVTNKVLGEFRIHSRSITGLNNNRVKYKKDLNAILSKLLKAGFLLSKKSFIQSAWFKLNPLRRFKELIY